MKYYKSKKMLRFLSMLLSASMVLAPLQYAKAAEVEKKVLINEINSSPDDWVEIMNIGTEKTDISGYEIRDNSNDHRWRFSDGTTIEAGNLLLVEATTIGQVYNDETKDYVTGEFQEAIGIGGGDSIRLYDAEGNLLDEHAWTEHASHAGDESIASIGRYPDGIGSFTVMPETPGKSNDWYAPPVVTNSVVLNEVQSSDPNDGPDWIELANPTNNILDISGLVIKDSDDTHEYVIPEGTTIPANGFLVLTDEEFGFGLGKGDSVRIFENDLLIASTTWADHTNPTWGLYPDVNGTEYRNTKEETPGTENKFDGIPEAIQWPGNSETFVYDIEPTFLEDSSGLDFYNGQLYAVDNGTGKFWVLNVAEDGSMSFAEGFENGKRVRFQKDAENASAPGPDAEGITVDGDGFVYLASERDNYAKGVNYNVILKADPKTEGNDLVALQEWDITTSLPQVAANMGIESVEWVSNADIVGKLYDQNTNAVFDEKNYPNAVAGGVFFVALEDNGHVYAYVLNSDGSSVQISDIDSKLGGAMALDYDAYEKVLWVVADNGYGNRAAKISFCGEKEADIVHVLPAGGVDVTANNEGFAIAEYKYTKDGQRPVYRFQDGITQGALTVGSLACDYKESTDGDDNQNTEDNTQDTEESIQENIGGNNQENVDEDDSETIVEEDESEESTVVENYSKAPKTGDENATILWSTMALGSALCFLYLLKKKKHVKE